MNNHVDVNVCGVQGLVPCTYKTVVLKPNVIDDKNILTQSMMNKPNTKYVIKYDFLLSDAIVEKTVNVISTNVSQCGNAGYADALAAYNLAHDAWIDADNAYTNNPNDTTLAAKNAAYAALEAAQLTLNGTPQYYYFAGSAINIKKGQHITIPEGCVLLNDTRNGIVSFDVAPNDMTVYIGSATTGNYDYKIQGGIVMPANCLIEFDGGSISDGVLIGDETILIFDQKEEVILKNVELLGEFEYSAGGSGGVDKKDNVDGMATITLKKNKSFASQLTQTNTIYRIMYDFTLGEDITVPANCVLEFDGGSIANATGNEYQINFNNGCYIDAPESAVIFKDIVFTPMNVSGGVLKNTTLYPAWFGCTVGSDLVQTLPAVMACAYATGVHNIQFSSGKYTLSGEVTVGGTQYVNFDFNIKGNGLGLYGGTIFQCTTATSRFRIDMSESEYGYERTFHISDIAFEGSNGCNALMVTRGMGCSIERCRFRYCGIAIKFVNAAYLTKVDSCIFANCERGIYADNDPLSPDYVGGGQTNNNVISNCVFAYCSISTIDLRSGGTNGWQIVGGDCEGYNGTLYLGSNNFIRGTRLERNLDSVPYLTIGSKCRVYDVAIHTSGGAPDWRVVVEGDNNYIDCLFIGFNVKGIVSYGKGNKFNVITQLTESHCLMLYDENDEFILNGYSNKKDYPEEANQTGWFPRGDNSNKLINKGLKQYMSLANRANGITIMNPIKYITGSVYSYDSNVAEGADSTIVFYGGGHRFKNIDKWFAFSVAYASSVSTGPDLFFIAESYQSNTWKQACINVTCSENIPIYNRPCVGPPNDSTKKDFHAYYDKNGHIQLVDTFIGYQYLDFGLYDNGILNNRHQILTTPFGKNFYYDGSEGKYYDLEGNRVRTVTSGDGLVATPYNKVEFYDLEDVHGYFNMDVIFYNDGSRAPDCVVKKEIVLSKGTSNPAGTIDIMKNGVTLHSGIIGYVTEITPYKGLAAYSDTNNKPVWYDGTQWVDATGATV